MSRLLHISKQFSLPLELVTESQAILAKKGAGKTYTAMVEAEEMLKAQQQIVAVDPTGAWWGLKSSADGKSAGFSIPILGGEHADIPLNEDAGELVASAIIENRFSAVLDLGLFRKNAMRRFMTSFLEKLYHSNREALHLFIDEADLFAPQNSRGTDEVLIGAMEDIVRRGRVRGVGTSLISQRPAVLHKDVLTQCEVLVALRMTHPLDIAAIRLWAGVHGAPGELKELESSLPTLVNGEAWFWAPAEAYGIFRRVQVRQKETFNSSATPKPGERAVKPKTLAEIDLDKLGQSIQQMAVRAKENDPNILKRQIAELKRELTKKATVNVLTSDARPVHPTPPAYPDLRAEVKALQNREKKLLGVIGKLGNTARSLADTCAEAATRVESGASITPLAPAVTVQSPPHVRVPSAPVSSRRPSDCAESNGNLTGPEQRILNAIAWMEAVGVPQPEQPAVAFLAGYTFGSGAFNNPKGKLNQRGLIHYLSGGRIELTTDGRALSTVPGIPTDTSGLQNAILRKLPGPERRILKVLIDAYPKSLSAEECANRAEYAPGSGAFNNPRGKLRSLGLVEYPGNGEVRARNILFLD